MPDRDARHSHPRPIMAADSVVFSLRNGGLCVVLIRRDHEPYEDHWAIPGGFVNENEQLDVAAARELEEETGLANVAMHQMQAFGDPGRDPRGWAVSIVYLALIDSRQHTLKAGDDAREVGWFSLANLPPLAFDHDRILQYAMGKLLDTVWGGGDSNIVPSTYTAAEREILTTALANLSYRSFR